MSHVDLLKNYELKATPQRLCILDTLDKYGHATLEEIEKYSKEKFPTLSLSTIYRNINEMIKKDVLSEVKIANKKDYFEITKEKHVHLICKECGKIEDLMVDSQEIIQKFQKQTQSKILDTTISFDVICKECLSRK
ncbi:Fur family transcriptional regulator [Sulfurospirillum sp. 1307]|jgi:Fur family peroxide stress response transcriptional regulator